MDTTLSSALQCVAFLSGVMGQWLIARRSRNAFVAWTLSNIVLIVFAGLSEAWWLLAMYSVYLAGSVFAWLQWGRSAGVQGECHTALQPSGKPR